MLYAVQSVWRHCKTPCALTTYCKNAIHTVVVFTSRTDWKFFEVMGLYTSIFFELMEIRNDGLSCTECDIVTSRQKYLDACCRSNDMCHLVFGFNFIKLANNVIMLSVS